MPERNVNDRRRLEALAAGPKDDAPQSSVQEHVSVLQDAEGLRKAALKASNGGKKRIVGLYLPDGNRIVTEEKVKKEEKDKKVKGAKEAASDVTKKDFKSEALRKKSNLSEVSHAYCATRAGRQRKAYHDKKTEEDLDDAEAERKAQVILNKTNEIEKVEYNKLFDFFDVDKDRTWGSIEFAQRMTDIGFPTGVEDAANLLYFAGVRDVDRISYNDFLEMMPKLKAFRRIIEKDAMRMFSEKDPGTGYITSNALRDVMYKIAGPDGADPAFVEAVVKKSDRERTGRITFPFFIRALFGTPPMLQYTRDSKRMTMSQRFVSTFGRFCGAKHADPDDIDFDEEDSRA